MNKLTIISTFNLKGNLKKQTFTLKPFRFMNLNEWVKERTFGDEVHKFNFVRIDEFDWESNLAHADEAQYQIIGLHDSWKSAKSILKKALVSSV